MNEYERENFLIFFSSKIGMDEVKSQFIPPKMERRNIYLLFIPIPINTHILFSFLVIVNAILP